MPQYVIEKLYEVTGGDAFVTSDVGQHQMWAAQYYKFDKPRRWINSGGLGTIGVGLPYAMGVRFDNPKATVAGDTGSWTYLLIMLVVTLGGIFVLSTLIGILTTGIEARLESLRKGRSRVVEVGHTIILGWSEQIFPIISELVAANANLRKSCIVVLAAADKVEMEDAVREKVGPAGKTRNG